jgi:glycosyltransferase involved in cell wall biosynthesis
MNRILFLSSIYPRSYDRTRGTYCHATCRALAASRPVRVIAPIPWMEAARMRDPRDPALQSEVGPVHYPTYWYPPGFARHSYAWWMWHSTKSTLRRVSREFRPEGIMSYWAHPDGSVALRLARELGIPCGITVGGSDVLLLPRDPRRKRAIARTLSAADAVFAVSQDIRRQTVRLGVDPGRVHVVLQGVDEAFAPGSRPDARARLGVDAEAPVLLWVGRMAPVKGLEVLLAAMPAVAREFPDMRLYLVGDGPPRAKLERQAAQLGVGENVRFMGNLPPEELPDWYRAANLTVLSSHSEGIPNVLRESLACGVPYVATRVGGIPELHDGPAATLVPPGDPAALAAGIVARLRAPPTPRDDWVERGWSTRADELVSVLSRCRPRRRGRA